MRLVLNVLLTGPIPESECASINLKRSIFRTVAQSIGKVMGKFVTAQAAFANRSRNPQISQITKTIGVWQQPTFFAGIEASAGARMTG